MRFNGTCVWKSCPLESSMYDRGRWVAASFEVSRAAPKSARVRGARIKPEAHSYIDVKACDIACVSAAVDNPEEREKTDR